VAVFAAASVPAGRTLAHWFSMRAPELPGLDFTLYCATARIGLQHGWDRLYDLAAQRQISQSMGISWVLPNVYTPAMSLLSVPFAAMSPEHGYLAWSALLLASLIACCWLLAPGDAPARVVHFVLVLVPYAVQLALFQGQVIPLQMAAVAVSFALLTRGRDAAAGAVLVALILKPQGMQLLPFALLVAGRRRAFAGWLASTVLAAAGVLMLIGTNGLLAYADRLGWARTHPVEMMVAWDYTLARRFQPAWLASAILALAAALALVAARRHRRSPELVYAAAIVGSLLASPYLHLNDLIWLFPAGWLLLRALPTAYALVPLAACYVFILYSTPHASGARWVLLFECLFVAGLAAAPRSRRLVVESTRPGTS
jgi:glycosyl transferase family 87